MCTQKFDFGYTSFLTDFKIIVALSRILYLPSSPIVPLTSLLSTLTSLTFLLTSFLSKSLAESNLNAVLVVRLGIVIMNLFSFSSFYLGR